MIFSNTLCCLKQGPDSVPLASLAADAERALIAGTEPQKAAHPDSGAAVSLIQIVSPQKPRTCETCCSSSCLLASSALRVVFTATCLLFKLLYSDSTAAMKNTGLGYHIVMWAIYTPEKHSPS